MARTATPGTAVGTGHDTTTTDFIRERYQLSQLYFSLLMHCQTNLNFMYNFRLTTPINLSLLSSVEAVLRLVTAASTNMCVDRLKTNIQVDRKIICGYSRF